MGRIEGFIQTHHQLNHTDQLLLLASSTKYSRHSRGLNHNLSIYGLAAFMIVTPARQRSKVRK